MMSNNTHVIVAVAGGFYFFGREVAAQEGYIRITDAAMFRGFSGGKGLPGVARGDKAAKVNLDFFSGDVSFPLTAVYAIMPSIDLRTFSGTTINA